MTTRKAANNVVFLIRGDAGEETIVKIFRPRNVEQEDGKVVRQNAGTALQAFLNSVFDDADHELHGALMAGELQTCNTHLNTISVREERKVRPHIG